MIRFLWAFGLALFLFGAGLPSAAFSQDEPEKKDDEPKAEAEEKKPEEKKPKAKESKNGVKPFDEVITEDAETDAGLFFVHRVDGKVFYEIPADALNTPMLWVTQVAQTSEGRDIMGTLGGDLVVRWEFREADEQVLLREVRFTMRAEEDDPIAGAVEASSLAPIIKAFPIAAYGKDKAMVIDVTELFTGDVAEISIKDRLGAAGNDPKRTFIDVVKSFPENIEVKVLTTLNPKPPQGPGGGFFGGGGANTITALVHHSMIKLPGETDAGPPVRRPGWLLHRRIRPTSPRSAHRSRTSSTSPASVWRRKTRPRNFPSRSSRSSSTSAPEMPRALPRRGQEGHRGLATGVREGRLQERDHRQRPANPRAEDPDWDAEDARYSVIRWVAEPTQNAMGPHVHDPRSGETISAHRDLLARHLENCPHVVLRSVPPPLTSVPARSRSRRSCRTS